MDIDGFVIGSAGLPASEEDALPLESQGAKGGVVAFAFFSLSVVEGASPFGLGDGLAGPFDEGLAQELPAGEPAMDEVGVATLFGDRCDTGVALEGGGVAEASAVVAEGDQEPGSERSTRAGQGVEERCVRLGIKELADPVLIFGDLGAEQADPGHQSQ